MQSRKGDRQQTGVFHIVDSHDANIVGDTSAKQDESVHQIPSSEIVGTNKSIWSISSQDGPDQFCVGRVTDADHIASRFAGLRLQCLAIPGNASVYRRCGIGSREEGDSLGSCPNQVLGGQVSSSTVIDTDQIILTAPRIGFEAPVKKNDGDSGP
ncbi:MAG: hypothetical protein WB460_16695, partial [Candidatus Acidiferrales bacterium]